MVFTKLSAQEKEAFFGLLDEYFQSRPEIFGEGGGGPVISTTAAASIAQQAISAGSHLGASGAGRSNNPYVANMASNPEIHSAVGRVAAASLAFNNNNTQTSTSRPEPPGRAASVTASIPRGSVDQVASPGGEIDKLVTRKTSVFSSFKNKPQLAGTVSIPPAFSAPKGTFAPPPVRRAASDAGNAIVSPVPSLPRRQAAPQPEPEEEEEEEEEETPRGEWADVLYDYTSEDPADLAIQAGGRVLIVAKDSDDWWTGQVEGQGRTGLFPASYVKLL